MWFPIKTQETFEPAFCLGWNYMKGFPVFEIVWPYIHPPWYTPFLVVSLSLSLLLPLLKRVPKFFSWRGLATFNQHKGVHLERSGGDQMVGVLAHNEYPLGTGHRYGIRWPMKFEMVVFAELCWWLEGKPETWSRWPASAHLSNGVFGVEGSFQAPSGCPRMGIRCPSYTEKKTQGGSWNISSNHPWRFKGPKGWSW